ncbi:MAG TPA: hypothetical protein VMT50_04445 [Steroidobacteraceae bacterium]|nr:hypothetical protein [Steroidobacteraceae bacterium]
MTPTAQAALAQLRDPHMFAWHVPFFLVLLWYLYGTEIGAGRWDRVAAGLALWLADWINELINSFILHWTGVHALWIETGPTAYQILVGLNIETSMLFLMFGLLYARMLPEDPSARIAGLNARWFWALNLSVGAVITEVVLNAWGVLNWYWWFWNLPWGLPVIVVFGYLWFFLAAARALDAPTPAARWRFVGTLAGLAGVLAAIGGACGWL